MSVFVCPKCQCPLKKEEKSYCCPNGHIYDISKEGYVNLILANMVSSKDPGDSKEMAKARNEFLTKGYYKKLADELSSVVKKYSKDKSFLLDCGCGEGYYTETIANAVKNITVAGIDISKPSIKIAAKRSHRLEYAVASVFSIPTQDEKFGMVLNCFSPLCVSEYRRVLEKDGIYIYVVPGPRHLWQMKEAIYDYPYENTEEDIEYEGFSHVECVKIRYEVNIDDKNDIKALFGMTPYYWKTSEKGHEKLNKLNNLSTEISFDIHIYKKE